MNQSALRYEIKSKTVIFQGKPITVINRTPILTSDQREKRRIEIENRLYDVVKKHRENA